MKGHTLIWDHPRFGVPTWLPSNPDETEQLMNGRINQIAERYKTTIPIWDVANEVIKRSIEIPMPKHFALKAFKQSAQVFPAETKLLINETTGGTWQSYLGEYSSYYLLIQNLLLQGAKIDGIGFQYHLFSEQLQADVAAGKALTLIYYSKCWMVIRISSYRFILPK